MVAGCRLLAAGSRLLASGFWLLAENVRRNTPERFLAGSWKLVAGS
jgi:hypothetical protein